MIQDIHFPVPVGNEFTLRVLVVLSDETVIPAASLTDIMVKAGDAYNSVAYNHTEDETYIYIPFPANQPIGKYDLHITAKAGGRSVAAHYRQLIDRVPWGMAAPQTVIPVKWFLIGLTDSEMEELREELREKIEAAEAAKESYENLKAALESTTGIAKEATLGTPKAGASYTTIFGATEAVKDAVDDIELDLSPVTDKLDNTTYGLNALKTAISDVDTDLEATASLLKATDGTSMLTKIWNAVNGVFNTLKDFIKVAPKKTDLPTDYATEEAATENKNAVIAAIPSIPTDYATADALSDCNVDVRDGLGRIGSASDAATANTLFGKIGKATAKVDGVADKIGDLQFGGESATLADIVGDLDNAAGGDLASQLQFALQVLNRIGDLKYDGESATLADILGDMELQGSGGSLASQIGDISPIRYRVGQPSSADPETLFAYLAAIRSDIADLRVAVDMLKPKSDFSADYDSDYGF